MPGLSHPGRIINGRKTGVPAFAGRAFTASASNLLQIGPSVVSKLLAGGAAVTVIARVRPTGSGDRTIFAAEISESAGASIAGASLTVTTAGVVRAGGRSQVADSFQSKVGATVVPSTGWQAIGGEFNVAGDTIDVYLNGVLDTSGSNVAVFGATAYTPGTVFAGRDRIGANAAVVPIEPFSGDGCDVAVFNRVLTAAEHLAFSNGTRPDQLSGGAPVLYFPMDYATDGPGRVANSRQGGLEAVPLGNVGNSSNGLPTMLQPTAAAAETRFRPVRVWRLKGSDASAVGSGANIPTVDVRHAGLKATQATAGNQPTYLATGSGAIRFTAADSEYLTMPGFIDLSRGITVVALADCRGTGRILSAAQLTTSDTANAAFFGATNGLGISGAASAAFSAYTDYTVGVTGLALFSGRFSGNAISNWLNGVKRNGTVSGSTELSDGSFVNTSLPDAATAQLVQLGRRLNSAASPLHFDGDLYDFIMVNGALTDEEVQFLEGVIAWENSQTALLPASHPWKTTQPAYTSSISYPWGVGAIVARSDAPATKYPGSPSLCRADGKLYALHDLYTSITVSSGRLYVSANNGETWYGLADFPSAFIWGTIWQHTDGYLYILALTNEWSDIKIGKSTDNGATWTFTTLSNGVLLAAAGAAKTPPNYHVGPQRPLYHGGYIFLAFENQDPYTRDGPSQDAGFDSGVIWALASADLTLPASWTATAQMATDITGTTFAATTGYIEGGLVVDDANAIWKAMRPNVSGEQNKAVFFPMGWTGTVISNPAWSSTYVKTFPGGDIKFQITKDGTTFYSVVNENNSGAVNQRNRVKLVSMSSASLATPAFASVRTIVDEAVLATFTGMTAADSRAYHGFQYPAFEINGETVNMLFRTAWSGANDYHNANVIGFGTTSKT